MIDLRWRMVTCCGCGKRYRCTPNTDYFHLAGFPKSAWTATNGRCWDCHLKANGVPAQAEPKLGEPEFQ